MNRARIHALCAALLALAPAGTAAQEAAAPDSTAVAPRTPQAPPGALEIAARSTQLADSAALARGAVDRLASTQEIAADLDDATERHQNLEALVAAMSAADYVRPERVSRVRDQALLEQQRLEELATRTLERVQQLGDVRAAWVDRQTTWRAWEQSLREDADYPVAAPELRRSVASIDSVLEGVSVALTGLLTLQRSIEELRTGNEALRGVLAEMRSGGRGALLAREQPLLFSPEHRAQLAEGGWRAWSPAAALRLNAYPAFIRDNAGILLIHLLIVIAIAVAALKLRLSRGENNWSGLIDHPWVLGTFVSTVIALQHVLLAPPLWDVLVWSVLGVTSAVLARQLFAAYALRLTVYLFAAFYPVFLLFEAMQLPTAVFRTALAIIAGIALPGFALMARRRSAIAAAENVNDPRRIWPLRIGALMWAVVLGAIVLGYDSLGRWVLHAAMTSGAVIFIVLVLLALVRGAVASLVVSDPGVRRHLAVRVAVRLAQRLIFVIQIVTVIAAVLVLLDVWQLTGSPVATWQAITETGFDAGPIRITIGRILLGILVIYAGVTVSWLVRNIVESEVRGRWQVDRGVAESINKLLHYLLITIAIVVALAVLGVQLRNFAIVAGALGIGIGFGLQNVVSNFASGLILLFERPVRVGDTVVVAGEWGTITKIGLRSTVMMTLDQSEMIVPNTDLVSEKVVNWTLTNPTARVIMEVGVAYGTDIAIVLRILTEAGMAHEATLEDPPPQALFMGFGESSLDFEIRVWVREIRSRLEVRSVVLTEIQRRFNEVGIEIPFPQRDLHVRSVDAAAARALAAPPDNST